MTAQLDRKERADERRRPRQSAWAPVLVNLLLGLAAVVPLYCAQWLVTEYLPMDCRSSADIAGATNCDYHTLDHAGPMMLFLVVTGVFVLFLVVVVDIVLPLARDRPLRPWLGSIALLFVPYATLWALYLGGVGT